jgi:hypothetical protein
MFVASGSLAADQFRAAVGSENHSTPSNFGSAFVLAHGIQPLPLG